MPKYKSGIKRGSAKGNENRSKIFAWAGSGKISPEALKAVLEAPVGTKIHANASGLGSYAELEYEITLYGMTKKMLSYQNKPGEGYHKPVVLSKANVKKKLSGSKLTLVYPSA